MRREFKNLALIVIAAALSFLFVQCDQDSNTLMYEPNLEPTTTMSDGMTGKTGLHAINTNEMVALLQLEKMAGLEIDLIDDLAEQHRDRTLMDMVELLSHEQLLLQLYIDMYGVDMSLADDGTLLQGYFSDDVIKSYALKGQVSNEEALRVIGNLLEQHIAILYRMNRDEWDFRGLTESFVFSELNANKNLRNIAARLQAFGIEYQPAILPQDIYLEIINGS